MILQFFAAFIGAAGFGFLFHLQFKHIFPAALGGVLTWVIYVIANIWGVRCFYFLTICQRLCCNLLRSHCKNNKSSHHTFSYHLCCCFDSRRFSLLHDELCCSKAMAVCRNVWFQNRPMYIRTCHRNEPHMDISRYGKKGLLFNSLGENRRKKK